MVLEVRHLTNFKEEETMEENKTMVNEETKEEVKEETKETEEMEEVRILGISEDEYNDIQDDLRNHKEHIENLYKKVEEKQSLINLKNVDAVGITKWIAIAIIGVTVAKNEGGFGLDIPFFHIRFGKETK